MQRFYRKGKARRSRNQRSADSLVRENSRVQPELADSAVRAPGKPSQDTMMLG